MTTSRTVLHRKDKASCSALYIAFDLGDKSWHISLGDDRFHVSRYNRCRRRHGRRRCPYPQGREALADQRAIRGLQRLRGRA